MRDTPGNQETGVPFDEVADHFQRLGTAVRRRATFDAMHAALGFDIRALATSSDPQLPFITVHALDRSQMFCGRLRSALSRTERDDIDLEVITGSGPDIKHDILNIRLNEGIWELKHNDVPWVTGEGNQLQQAFLEWCRFAMKPPLLEAFVYQLKKIKVKAAMDNLRHG